MSRYSFGAAAVAICLWSLSDAPAAAGEDDYKFSAQDRIMVKIYEWHEEMATIDDWPALSGNYVINQRGQIVVPIIGPVDAAGHTAAEVADVVGDRLKTTAGLDSKPNVVVDVVSYRPFYVTGDVQRSGDYEFRPGLLVRHALIVSGGLPRPREDSLWQQSRDLISFRGEATQLAIDLARLQAKRARLEAEVEGRDEIAFPTDLVNDESGAVKQILKEEQSLFSQRLDARRQLASALDTEESFAKNEIKVLEDRISVTAKQQQETEKAFARVRRSLGRSYQSIVRILTMQRDIATLKSTQLEYQTRIATAQQDIARANSSFLRAQLTAVDASQTELSDTNANIETSKTRMKTLEALIDKAQSALSKASADQSAANVESPARISIRRGTTLLQNVDLDTPILPGDLITVDATLPAVAADAPGSQSDSRSEASFEKTQ